jgi:UDP-glucose 4-epimerase
VGRYLVEEAQHHDLTLIGRSSARLRDMFGSDGRFQLAETDYSEGHLVEILEGVEAVAHLAGVRHEKHYQSIADYAPNFRAAEHLYNACLKVGVSNLVYTSSRTVYSPAVNKVPFIESEAVAPRLLYGISKLIGECLGLAHEQLNLKCLRLSQLVAAEEREGYMLRTFIDHALSGQDLVLFGEGVGRREYLYVRDAARAILTALSVPEASGVFNVGSGRSTSHRELAELVLEVFAGGQGHIISHPEKPEDTSTVQMDSSKFRETFGWRPDYTLAEGLREIKEIREA